MKIAKFSIITAIWLIVAVFGLLAWTGPQINQAGAQSLWEMQEGKEELGGAFGETGAPEQGVKDIVVQVIKIFLGFLSIIMIILIIYGGFRWMTARGNENQVEEAKKIIKYAIVGGVVIIAAYALTEFVIRFVVKGMLENEWETVYSSE